MPQYRAYTGKSSSDDDLLVAADLNAASRFIEKYLHGRFFGQEGTEDVGVTRTYMPKSGPVIRSDWAESENPWKYGGMSRVLDIDDLVSVEAITIDERLDNTFSRSVVSADYELLPRNAALGPEPKPYNQLSLTPYGSVYAFPRNARVRITGVWGWPSIPEVIRMACIKWTGIMRNEGPEATGQLVQLDQVVTQSDEGRRMAYLLMRAYNDKVTF